MLSLPPVGSYAVVRIYYHFVDNQDKGIMQVQVTQLRNHDMETTFTHPE